VKDYKIYAEVLEPKALQQFMEAMDQESTVAGALMPDAHAGYTLPIGAVIATNNKVYPSYVGYDIGCTDMDTEFLTDHGWKKISDYEEGDKVLEYDLEKDSCSFEFPVAYIKKECLEFNKFDNKVVNQMLSDEHRILLFSSRSERSPSVIRADDAVEKNIKLSKGINQVMKCTIPSISNDGVDFTDDELRLIIAISADGSIRKNGSIEFHIKKERKIARLKKLCKALDVDIHEFDLKTSNFACRINFNGTKNLSFLWGASVDQLKVISEEVVFWDGHDRKDKGTITYSTTIKDNADVIQFALSCCGIRTNIQEIEYIGEHQKNWSKGYTVYTTKNSFVRFPNKKDISRVDSVDGFSYCFTTNTGYWVMRRGGRIAITGNCGMCATRTTYDVNAIRENSLSIMNQIYEDLPVGFKHHDAPQETSLDFFRLTPEGLMIAADKKALSQLGTLGGGNHFVEIGCDEMDRVWIVVHSGSRGFGHGIAEYYMKLASPSGKASEGFYGFDADSDDGNRYINDLDFALDFALENRAAIIKTVMAAINKFVPGETSGALINRNHNHAELKDGLWIHRKGATHAEAGMEGVIPGNMRDGSFIVKGKGNPDSLYSSSHGAGRVMGRAQAAKTLSYSEFQESMVGVTARTGIELLDESPKAYKDIFEVMRLQEDLVEVVCHVKPIINIKGN